MGGLEAKPLCSHDILISSQIFHTYIHYLAYRRTYNRHQYLDNKYHQHESLFFSSQINLIRYLIIIRIIYIYLNIIYNLMD